MRLQACKLGLINMAEQHLHSTEPPTYSVPESAKCAHNCVWK